VITEINRQEGKAIIKILATNLSSLHFAETSKSNQKINRTQIHADLADPRRLELITQNKKKLSSQLNRKEDSTG